MNTFSSIIGLWPSATALAEDLGENPVTVRAWAQRNSIPGDRWLLIVSAARRRGIQGVTLEVLARIAAGQIDASPIPSPPHAVLPQDGVSINPE